MPKPFRGVVEGEADHQQGGEGDLVGRRGLADRQALGEVVQADAHRDQQRQLPTRGPGRDAASLQLLARHGAGADRLPRPTDPPPHPGLVLLQTEQSHAQSCGEEQAVAERRAEAGPRLVVGSQRLVDRLPRRGEHVPDQEDQDADRQRVERHPQRLARPSHPAQRHSAQDGDAGDEAEQEGLADAHGCLTGPEIVR